MQEAWDQIEAIPGYARKKSGIPKIREFLGLWAIRTGSFR